jgi:hypothetical protein
MVQFKVIPATSDHLQFIADNMRKADVDELMAMSGSTPQEAIEKSLGSSDWCFVGLADEVPMCAFGVGTVSLLSRVGVPWLLGTKAIETHYRAFARGSVMWRDYMKARYDMLVNAVDARNTLSKRWLMWLGFTLSEAVPMGVSKLPFHPFELRSGHV